MPGKEAAIRSWLSPQLWNCPGLSNVLVFSLGSDGTDGPTDAAGGIVDGATFGVLQQLGISIPSVLAENDAYHALKHVDGLIVTGPTGTNVNDAAVILIQGKNDSEKLEL